MNNRVPVLNVVTAPASEPVTLEEAKLFLRVEHNDEDAMITGLIVAAREAAEGYMKRSLVTQTLSVAFDDYAPMQFVLPRGKVQSVESVKFIDKAGDETLLTSGQYYLTAGNRALVFVVTPLSHQIEIVYLAGFGDADAVPNAIKQGMKAHVAYMYENRMNGSKIHGESRGYYAPFREFEL